MNRDTTASRLRTAVWVSVFVSLWLAPLPLNGRDIPVIAAQTTPVKVKPADPGGMVIPYQDIFVMNPSLSARAEQTTSLMPSTE